MSITKNKRKIQVGVLVTSILVLALSVSYAYFAGTIGSGATTPINVQSGTTDNLYFTKGSALNIVANQENFAKGNGNLSSSTTSSATLVANSNTKTATETYQVYLNITANEYVYTQNSSTPEIILTVTKPDGTELTAVEGLKYVTVGSVTGFDITTKKDLIKIAENYTIISNNFTAGVTQNWTFKVTFINLETKQEGNEGKTLNAEVMLQKEKKRGVFANKILKNNDGEAAIKAKGTPDFSKSSPPLIDYTDNNFDGSDASSQPSAKDYFTYADSYTFNNQTGTYTLTNPQVCQYSSCYAILVNKYVVDHYGSSSSTAATSTNKSTIYKIETTTSTTLTYKSSSTTRNYDMTDKGMYAAADDYGTSYYFRGAVDNNWVKFAGFYWRIVRINGDGSVKLIYTGTAAPTESQKVVMTGDGTNIGISAFNGARDQAEYVGYMYTLGEVHGTGTDSLIKTTLDTWYEAKLASYSSYLVDTIFCNDRTAYTDSAGTIVGGGTGTTGTTFGASIRSINRAPVLTCPTKLDAFTVSDTAKGNVALTYPVGLLTFDEVATSGLVYGQYNYNNYLYTDNIDWLLSPKSNLFGFVTMSFGIYINFINANNNVRPVVSLVSDANVTGSGQWNDPYVVVTN